MSAVTSTDSPGFNRSHFCINCMAMSFIIGT